MRAGKLFYWKETNWCGMTLDDEGGVCVWDPDSVLHPGEHLSWEVSCPDSIKFDVVFDPEEWK